MVEDLVRTPSGNVRRFSSGFEQPSVATRVPRQVKLPSERHENSPPSVYDGPSGSSWGATVPPTVRLSTTAAAEEPSLLTLEERLAVVNLYEELGSYRAVAAIVGCDHKTVKAHVERGQRGAVVARVVELGHRPVPTPHP